MLRCAAVYFNRKRFGERRGLQGSAGVCEAAGEERGTEAHLGGSRSGAGDHRDHAPRDPRRRPGVALRESQRLANAFAHQCSGQRAAHSTGAGDRFVRGSGRAHSRFPGRAGAARAAGQNQDAAQAGGAGFVLSEDGEDGAVQGGGAARRLLASGISDFAMLAAGCGAIHHLAAGDHAQSGDRKAQRGRLSNAGVRRKDHGHALANAKARRGTFSAGARGEPRGPHRRGRGHRRGPGHLPGGNPARSRPTWTR